MLGHSSLIAVSIAHDCTYSSPILAAFVVEDIVVSLSLIQDNCTLSTSIIDDFQYSNSNLIVMSIGMVRLCGVECWCWPATTEI